MPNHTSNEHDASKSTGTPRVKENAHTASEGQGAHEKKEGEAIKSRSADPGQSSYGGFSGEDTKKQAQELDPKKSEPSKPKA